VNRSVIGVCILVSGVLLGFLHYKLKPSPTNTEVRDQSRTMIGYTEWRGHLAPDFELKINDGTTFRLSENVGKKIIVLNFFATWCGPCRAEMPELNSYFNAHKSEQFLLLAIDSEEQQDRVDDFFQELKLDFPEGIDKGSIQREYGVSSFPTTVLIGVDGKVQFYETGALANADVAFDKLLQENLNQIKIGRQISTDDYRQQAKLHPSLPVNEPNTQSSQPTGYKLDERGQRIAEHMDCPCGCDKKVKSCTCNTSNNITKALATEDFKGQSDETIMKGLNKRFCMGAM
jgi:thiol-disulfide isomerase/thioredoxin